jgi:hypothetical protein
MGGFASGRRCGDHPTRPLVEDTPALGITKIKKQLLPGTLIKQIFPNNFKALIEVHDKFLTLTFPFGGTIHHQSIQITKLRCHFGGSRSFMLCPECSKQYTIIYLGSHGTWACRSCLGLAYRTQRMDRSARHLHRAQKIRQMHLKGAHPSEKPWHMSGKKHMKWLEKIIWHQNQGIGSFTKWVNDIRKKYGK